MKLIQLELENFRQFERAVIDFGDGMTAIVGANGAGKTTILEAIAFALFAKQRDTQDTLRWHWATKGKYSVILRFQLGDKVFEVMRGETKAHLKQVSKDGEQVWATGKEQVEQACIKLLGMTYLRFKNSFCAEQKDLKFLNFERRTDVQQEIIRMLGYDRLKVAEDLARRNAKEARDMAMGIRQSLGDRADIEARVRDARLKLRETESAIQATDKESLRLEGLLAPARLAKETAEKYQRLGREMGEIRGRKDVLMTAVKSAEEAVQKAEVEAKTLEELVPREAAFRQVETELKGLEDLREAHHLRLQLLKDEERLLGEIADLESRKVALEVPDVGALSAERSGKEVAFSAAQKHLSLCQEEWNTRRRDAEAEAAGARALSLDLTAQLQRAEEMFARGICPECGQPLSQVVSEGIEGRRRQKLAAEQKSTDLRAVADALKNPPDAVTQAQAAVEAGKEALEKASKELQRATLLEQQCQGLIRDIAARTLQLGNVRKTLAETPSAYDAAQHEIIKRRRAELAPEHEKYMRLQDAPVRLTSAQAQAKRAREELDDAVSRYKDLRSAQASLGLESDEASDQAIRALLSLEAEIKSLASRRGDQERLLVSFHASLKQAEQLLEKHGQDQARLAEKEAADALYDQVSKQMRILRDLISTQIVPDLVGRASENLALLTNGRYLKLELDEKTFAASLIDGDTRKRVISGGEEDVVALSLRLALSELIQERQGHPMSLLILDEVFGSLDPERRQSVLDRLVALRPRFQQILVISHIEEINQVADRCLYVRHDTGTHASTVSDVPPQGLLSLDL